MTIFTIDEQNQIMAFASPEEAAAATHTPFDSFGSPRGTGRTGGRLACRAAGGHLE